MSLHCYFDTCDLLSRPTGWETLLFSLRLNFFVTSPLGEVKEFLDDVIRACQKVQVAVYPFYNNLGANLHF